MKKIKAGYVSFGTMFYEPANLKMISSRAEKQLTDAGLDLLLLILYLVKVLNRKEQ